MRLVLTNLWLWIPGGSSSRFWSWVFLQFWAWLDFRVLGFGAFGLGCTGAFVHHIRSRKSLTALSPDP